MSSRTLGLRLSRVRSKKSIPSYPSQSDWYKKYAASGHNFQKALERHAASGQEVKRMCRFRAHPKSPGAACSIRAKMPWVACSIQFA